MIEIRPVTYVIPAFAAAMLAVVGPHHVLGQVPDSARAADPAPDSLLALDSLARADSLQEADSLPLSERRMACRTKQSYRLHFT